MQANTAILTELVKNLELAKLALRRETPLIQVIDKPIFPLAIDRFGKLKGLLLGGILFVVLISIYLIINMIFNKSIRLI